jgi:hypothetical protein
MEIFARECRKKRAREERECERDWGEGLIEVEGW